jgi:hypothetical protein
MKALDATTFSELQEFTKDLESRPAERLLRDVADLVNTSESKAHIVGYVIAVKYRNAPKAERYQILDRLDAVAGQLPEGEQRERVAAIATRIRTQEA